MSARGALLFARYAYPPNELGYCGPDGAAALLRGDAPEEIARRARQFEGAWSYLEFIARAAGVADPLDEAVVQAYWVGNDLLGLVAPDELLPFLRTRFAGQAGGTWQDADTRAIAHHSFHVFEVYPWAAMLRRTGNPAAVSVLDRCRIRTGVVREVHGETATVRSRPLLFGDGVLAPGAGRGLAPRPRVLAPGPGRGLAPRSARVLAPGPVRDEVVSWSAGGHSLLSGLRPGDRVSLHWDWVCDVITAEQSERLESFERRQLALECDR